MNQEPPKIEFPCDNYPIRVMGNAGSDMQEFVFSVFEEHAPGYDRTLVQVKASREGNYESLTIYITATGTEQLQAVFEALKQHPSVKMVL